MYDCLSRSMYNLLERGWNFTRHHKKACANKILIKIRKNFYETWYVKSTPNVKLFLDEIFLIEFF